MGKTDEMLKHYMDIHKMTHERYLDAIYMHYSDEFRKEAYKTLEELMNFYRNLPIVIADAPNKN